MGIGMEKCLIQNLPDIVFRQLFPDLTEVVPFLAEPVGIVDGDAVDILHHQSTGGGIAVLHPGAGDIGDTGVAVPEFIHMAGLQEEVHFLLRHGPHFIEHHAEVDNPGDAARPLQDARRPAKEDDVPRHGVPHPRPLYLDGDLVAVPQHRRMDLGDGGGTERCFLKGEEERFHRDAVLRLHHLFDLTEGHRGDVRPQQGELLAVFRREHVLPHGEDLAELDEGRAQVLDNEAQLHGGEAAQDAVPREHGQDLPEAVAVVRPAARLSFPVFHGDPPRRPSPRAWL